MSATLIKGKNIEVSKISFSQPRKLDNGAKLVYMNYNGGRLSVQSPWMSLPWMMGEYLEGEYPKYSIDLSFKGMDEDPDLQAFHDRLKEVEDTIIGGGVSNCVSWFKMKNASREVIEAIFNPLLKVSRDKNGQWEAMRDRTGSVRPLVIKNTDGKTYNINGSRDDEDYTELKSLLIKNARIRVKMSCVGLWVASGKYMCQWQLTHAELDAIDAEEDDNFLPDTDDEGEDGTAESSNTHTANSGVTVEDSDDDNGDGDGDDNGDGNNDDNGDVNGDEEPPKTPEPEPEPEPVEPPKGKKKIVRKKKVAASN